MQVDFVVPGDFLVGERFEVAGVGEWTVVLLQLGRAPLKANLANHRFPFGRSSSCAGLIGVSSTGPPVQSFHKEIVPKARLGPAGKCVVGCVEWGLRRLGRRVSGSGP